MVWTDLPGVPQAASSQNPTSPLLNNLNLTVEVRQPGTCLGRYFGNNLSAAEESVWYQQPCTGEPVTLDAKNNVEVIRFFATSGRGDTGFTVKVASATGNSQPFSLVVWNAYAGTTAPPAKPVNFVATAGSDSSVTMSWNASAGATSYDMQRSAGLNDPYVTLPAGTSPYTDNGRSAMTTYLYRLRARNAAGVSEWTGDHATTVVFTDPVLTPGVTTAKAAHVTELRQAISAVRVAAGTNVTTWDEEPLPATIKASHVAELRSKLNEGLDALGVSTLTFTDGTLTPQGSVIKAVHIQQLRQGVE